MSQTTADTGEQPDVYIFQAVSLSLHPDVRGRSPTDKTSGGNIFISYRRAGHGKDVAVDEALSALDRLAATAAVVAMAPVRHSSPRRETFLDLIH